MYCLLPLNAANVCVFKSSTYRLCSCFTAQMQHGSHFPVSSSRPSVLTNIVKMMDTIIPDLKYTFGYHVDMRKNKPAKNQHRKPPNYRPKTRMLDPSKPELDTKQPSSRGRPCITRCTMKHSGTYQLCDSCKLYIECDGGYVSLIRTGWFHVGLHILLTLIG